MKHNEETITLSSDYNCIDELALKLGYGNVVWSPNYYLVFGKKVNVGKTIIIKNGKVWVKGRIFKRRIK